MDATLKKMLLSCCLLMNSRAFSTCPLADSVTTENFCASFKVAAQCHCIEAGLQESGMCTNMDQFYKKMINTLGTLQRICSLQRYTTKQECIDDWNCYRFGGLTSGGQLCSGTGHACD